MLEYVKGDVLNSGEKYIVHGCNCFNTMGSGIAKQVKHQYPDAYEVDQKTLSGDHFKLGHFTFSKNKTCTIFNAYTQFTMGNDKNTVYVDYNAIVSSIASIFRIFPEIEVLAMPKIGSGLANGSWQTIEFLLQSIAERYNKTIRVYIYE